MQQKDLVAVFGPPFENLQRAVGGPNLPSTRELIQPVWRRWRIVRVRGRGVLPRPRVDYMAINGQWAQFDQRWSHTEIDAQD